MKPVNWKRVAKETAENIDYAVSLLSRSRGKWSDHASKVLKATAYEIHNAQKQRIRKPKGSK